MSGSATAQASPASATARGIPHTAELASSWTTTEPPQATRWVAPSVPSRPMPVSTTPSAPPPNTDPAEAERLHGLAEEAVDQRWDVYEEMATRGAGHFAADARKDR